MNYFKKTGLQRVLFSLLLLIAGVGSAWGNVSYTVNWDTNIDGAGYTIVRRNYNSNSPQSSSSTTYNIITGNNAQTLTWECTSTNISLITQNNYATHLKINEVPGYTSDVSIDNTQWDARTITITYTAQSNAHSRYYAIEYNTGAPDGKGYSVQSSLIKNGTFTQDTGTTFHVSNSTSSSYVPTAITYSNMNSFIIPTEVDGYKTAIVYKGGSGSSASDPYTFTINYYKEWVVDGLVYSTFHIQSTTNQYMLPEGEVAVSLYMGETESVEDVMLYVNGVNSNNEQLSLTEGTVETLADDDGDGQGETTTYTCLGTQNWGTYTNPNTGYYLNISNSYYGHATIMYFYKRQHDVAISTKSTVNIKNEVTLDGQTYKVTAIQKFGFCYKKSDQEPIQRCAQYNGIAQDEIDYSNVNDRSNDYLTTVNFEKNSNITSIGDYAFQSCKKLGTIAIPYSVEYLGVGAFQCCTAMTKLEFQKNAEGRTNVTTIQLWTFYYCTGLQTATLVDGIEEIKGDASGSPFQYNISLTHIDLPNTLKTIGPHFLCVAKSLTSLIMPASLESIDGAYLHGCENLREVIILSPAVSLKYSYGASSSSNTFGRNSAMCGEHVNQCVFKVPADYLTNYTGDEVWGTLQTDGYRNSIVPIEAEKFVPTAGKWTTIIFPERVAEFKVYGDGEVGIAMTEAEAKDIFGDEVIFDKLTEVTIDDEDKSFYHMKFTAIDLSNGVPSGMPLMIHPSKEQTSEDAYVLFDDNDQEDSNFKLDMSSEHTLSVTADDGANIEMKGNYLGYYLAKDEFLFKNGQTNITDANGEETEYAFYKMARNGAGHVKACKCWWEISRNGISSTGNMTGYSIRSIQTGIDELKSEAQEGDIRVSIEIYDLNGRRVYTSPEQLPTGLFIVNGKKVLVK